MTNIHEDTLLLSTHRIIVHNSNVYHCNNSVYWTYWCWFKSYVEDGLSRCITTSYNRIIVSSSKMYDCNNSDYCGIDDYKSVWWLMKLTPSNYDDATWSCKCYTNTTYFIINHCSTDWQLFVLFCRIWKARLWWMSSDRKCSPQTPRLRPHNASLWPGPPTDRHCLPDTPITWSVSGRFPWQHARLPSDSSAKTEDI